MVGIGLGRFNTLDSQEEGKHLYFSSELLEEKNLLWDYTHKKTTTTNGVIHIAPYLNPRWRIP